MKRRFSKWLLLLACCLAAALLCVLAFDLVDRNLNGAVLDWFDRNYMNTLYDFGAGDTPETIVHQPDWFKLKDLLLHALMTVSVLFVVAAFAAAELRARRERRMLLDTVSTLLAQTMAEGPEAACPPEYAALSLQIAGFRAAMQQKERALRDETARKNELVTYLAHDLKTPLTSVIGYLSLMQEAPDMPQPQKDKYTRIALDKAYRLEGLVNEFFEIARYNLQEIRLQYEEIDLYYLLAQLTDEFFPVLSARGNTAELHADEDLTVNGDADKLARVFNNILKNAAAYSDPDTPIIITAARQADAVRVSFQNTGRTIPPEKLAAIFEKFYRLDSARAGDTGGAGLGLAIAREIVTRHGGTITAQSAERSTTFTVTLP